MKYKHKRSDGRAKPPCCRSCGDLDDFVLPNGLCEECDYFENVSPRPFVDSKYWYKEPPSEHPDDCAFCHHDGSVAELRQRLRAARFECLECGQQSRGFGPLLCHPLLGYSASVQQENHGQDRPSL